MKNKSQQLKTCKSNNIIIIISKKLVIWYFKSCYSFCHFPLSNNWKKILKLLRKKSLWKTQPEMISCVLMFYLKKKTKKQKIQNKTSEFIVWPIYLFIYSSAKWLGRRTFLLRLHFHNYALIYNSNLNLLDIF